MVRQRDAKQAEIDAKKAEIRAQLAAQEAALAELETRMKEEHQAAVETFQPSPAPGSPATVSAKRPREEDEDAAAPPPAAAAAESVEEAPAPVNPTGGWDAAGVGTTEDNAMVVDDGEGQDAKRMRVDESASGGAW